MTVTPYDVLPATAPTTLPTTPAPAGEAAGDFLAAFLAAMGSAPIEGPAEVSADPLLGVQADQNSAQPATPAIPASAGVAAVPATPAVPARGTVAGTAHSADSDAEPDADADPDAGTVAVIDPALAAVIVSQVPVSAPHHAQGDRSNPVRPRAEKAASATEAVSNTGAPAPISTTTKPVGRHQVHATDSVPSTRPAVIDQDAPAHAEGPSSPSNGTTASAPTPPTANAPAVPTALAPLPVAATAPASTATPPAPNTASLDRVAAQVFGEVTGLVSRGNGTHRITMTLNPEQLGEVRVVMTVRDGAVHVRMAAGHEARAALLDGSPELSRLLESSGATETRIVVRDLPAASPSTPNSQPTNTQQGGDGTPDQNAGTRADHQAKDGSDHTTSRPVRAEGTASGSIPKPIQPVIDTRAAGVDLTM